MRRGTPQIYRPGFKPPPEAVRHIFISSVFHIEMSLAQWNPYTVYKVGDTVQYVGISYKSLAVQRGVSPVNHDNWQNLTVVPTSGSDPATLARILEFLRVIDESIYFEGYPGFGAS